MTLKSINQAGMAAFIAKDMQLQGPNGSNDEDFQRAMSGMLDWLFRVVAPARPDAERDTLPQDCSTEDELFATLDTDQTRNFATIHRKVFLHMPLEDIMLFGALQHLSHKQHDQLHRIRTAWMHYQLTVMSFQDRDLLFNLMDVAEKVHDSAGRREAVEDTAQCERYAQWHATVKAAWDRDAPWKGVPLVDGYMNTSFGDEWMEKFLVTDYRRERVPPWGAAVRAALI